jgi:TPR repeat protein
VNHRRSTQLFSILAIIMLWFCLTAFQAAGQDASPVSNSFAFTQTMARAEKGDAAAQNQLALMYDLGQGTAQNHGEAVKWLEKAAQQGNAAAELSLGLHYQNGDGVAQDYAEAVKWLRKAAEHGGAAAQYSLGVCYGRGLGVKQDFAGAIKWYTKAANQGDPKAQYNLGLCYARGDGVTQDYSQAAKWYRKAAEQGQVAAQYSLGICYHEGRGVPASWVDAIIWFRAAAEQGHAAAQYDLGFMCAQGQGVDKDYVEAYKWYDLAAQQNQPNALQRRDAVALLMTPLQVAEGQRLSREFVTHKQGDASNQPDSGNSAVIGALPRFTGTGFFVTDDGWLLTCYHVVGNAARIVVKTKSGLFSATLTLADKANDLALLKVVGGFSALPLGPSGAVKSGAPVFTVGFPKIELEGLEDELIRGRISALTGDQDDPRQFQINIGVQPGDAGAPLVDESGNVIGMVESPVQDSGSFEITPSEPQSVSYAMKTAVMRALLESVPEVPPKLKPPNITAADFDAAAKAAEKAIALVLVY